MGMPHFTLDLRAGVPRGRRGPVPGRLRGGGDPEPVRRLQRPRAPGRDARARRPPRRADLATGHYARVTDDGLLRVAADPAKDQTYMLSALSPASLARMRFPLAELTKPEVRALAAEADLPVASRAESQDLCFLAGTGKARFLARHAGLEDAPGEIVSTRPARSSARTAASITSPSASARASAWRRAEPLYVLRTEASREPRRRRLARRAGRRPRRRARRAPAPSGRRGRRRPAALPLARSPLPRRRRSRPGTHRQLELELQEPFYGAAPGQSACLLRGDVIVGWATIIST